MPSKVQYLSTLVAPEKEERTILQVFFELVNITTGVFVNNDAEPSLSIPLHCETEQFILSGPASSAADTQLSWSNEAKELKSFVSTRPGRNQLSKQFIFSFFKSLNLVDKKITAIDNEVMSFVNLTDLSLTGNNISDMALFQCLPVSLQVLDLNANRLKELPNLCHLTNLCHLGASHNSINSIRAKRLPDSLFSIDLSYNNIYQVTASVESMRKFNKNTHLQNLTLIGNTIVLTTNYRSIFISECENLRYLDDIKIQEEEKKDIHIANTSDNIINQFCLNITIGDMQLVAKNESMGSRGGSMATIPQAAADKTKKPPIVTQPIHALEEFSISIEGGIMKSSLGAAVIVTPLYAPEHANNIVHFNFNDSVKIGTTKETKADMKEGLSFKLIQYKYTLVTKTVELPPDKKDNPGVKAKADDKKGAKKETEILIERELAETRDIGVGWIKLSSLFNKNSVEENIKITKKNGDKFELQASLSVKVHLNPSVLEQSKIAQKIVETDSRRMSKAI